MSDQGWHCSGQICKEFGLHVLMALPNQVGRLEVLTDGAERDRGYTLR